MVKPKKNLSFKTENGLNSLGHLRKQYLDKLTQPQELYLEMKVRRGIIWLILIDNQPVGYLILDSDHTLLEYYLKDMPPGQSGEIFTGTIDRFEINRILCKSFDTRLLASCGDRQTTTTAMGVLFRDYHPSFISKLDTSIQIKLGQANDIAILWKLNEEVWETLDEVAEFIANKNVFIYESGNRLIGFGIFSPVIPGRPDFDIGMMVAPPFRRQGHGTGIIQHLASHCRANRWRPICGCDIRNTASWNCLKRAGFISEHRLLLIELI